MFEREEGIDVLARLEEALTAARERVAAAVTEALDYRDLVWLVRSIVPEGGDLSFAQVVDAAPTEEQRAELVVLGRRIAAFEAAREREEAS